jgi:hypothetical protein
MISIIVSTYKPDNFNSFSENIKQTIGVDYEIIAIENPGIMGLCEAYNRGVSKAKYPYLCFSHDDIKINTYNWGNIIINQFKENKDTGIIGIAGEGYKPWLPTGWFFSFLSKSRRINITQTSQDKNVNKVYYNPHNKIFDNVLVVDGCWFCTTKKITDEIHFDENTFTGYHYYDIDFSLRMSKNYQVLVSYNIDIEHYSYGNYSKDWIVDTFRFHNKWKKYLPLSGKTLSKDEIKENEFHAFCYILDEVSKNKIGLHDMFSVLYSFRLLQLAGLKKWFKLQQYTWLVAFRRLTNKK